MPPQRNRPGTPPDEGSETTGHPWPERQEKAATFGEFPNSNFIGDRRVTELDSAPSVDRERSVVGRNAFWAVVQVGIATIVLFFVYRVLVRQIGVEQIGLLAIISALSVAARLSELGLTGAVARFVPGHLARGEQGEAAGVVRTTVVTLTLVVGVFMLVLGPILHAALGWILSADLAKLARAILPLSLFAIWLNLIAASLLSALDGVHRADRRAQIGIGSQLVFAVSVVVSVSSVGAFAVPLGQILQNATALTAGIILLGRYLPLFSSRGELWSWMVFKRIWRYGMTLQLISALVLVSEPLAKLLLNHFGSLTAVGYYELANRFISQARSLLVSANQVLVPYYAKLGKTDAIVPTVRTNMTVIVTTSAVLFSTVALSLPLVSSIWLGTVESDFLAFGMILTAGWLTNTLGVPIYFANIGARSVQTNLTAWVAVMSVMSIGGIVGGVLVGQLGVVIAVSLGLTAGTITIFLVFVQKEGVKSSEIVSRQSVRTLAAAVVITGVGLGSIAVASDSLLMKLGPLFVGVMGWGVYLGIEYLLGGRSACRGFRPLHGQRVS